MLRLIAPLIILTAPAAASASTAEDALRRARGLADNTGLSTTANPATLVGSIINAALGFLGVVFLGLVLYAGYLYLTAGGEEKKAAEAKVLLKNAVIGLIIITSAYAITWFVLEALAPSATAGATQGGN